MALSLAHTRLLQELFILATGKVANTANFSELEVLVGADGSMAQIDGVIDYHMNLREASLGKVGVIQQIAQQGLGITLDTTQAQNVINDFNNAGLRTWSAIFQWAASSTTGRIADILNNRGEAATYFSDKLVEKGTSGFFEGATVTNAVANLLQGIGQSTESLDASKQGLLDLSVNLSAEGIQSAVVDGYVAGAFVFTDANGNGKHDSGEWSTTTNAAGNYTLPRSGASGTITASGGTDIMTNKPFKGVLTAPAGSTVVNPLTTLVQTLVESGQSLAEAKAAVSMALGLPPQINPTSYDPLKILANPNSNSAAKQVAMDVQTKALQIANVITHAANAIHSASGSSSTLLGAADAVTTALASAIKAAASTGVTIDLTNTATLTNIMQTAATANTATTGATVSPVLLAQVAIISAASNVKADQAVNITDLAKAMVVSQGDATDAIISGAASGNLSAAVTSFTGASLDTAVNAAVPGFIAPGVGGPPATTTPTPTPLPEPAPSPFIVTNTAGLITFGGSASGDIDISITAGTATFSRQSITADTTVTAITTGKTIELATGQTLAVNSADVAAMNGVTLRGAGTLKSTDGLTVAQLNSLIYTGWTGTRTLHSVADTSTNLKNDTTWVTGAIAVTVTDAAATLADLTSIQAATAGLVNATAVTSTSGSAADALLLLVTNEGASGDKIDMNAAVAVTLSDTTVSLANLKSIEAATTGLVNATAVTSTSGSAADAVLLLTTNEGTSGDKIDMKADVTVTLSDTTLTLAELKTLEAATTGLVTAITVTSTSGTLADALLMLATNEGTSGNKIDMRTDVAVTVLDTGSVSAADLTAIAGATMGLVSATGISTITGAAADLKSVADALGTSGDKLNAGTVTGAVTNAALTTTSGASNAADAAAILAASSGAVTVRLANTHTLGSALSVATGDIINIDPAGTATALSASAQALVGDVDAAGEWHFDSGTKLFTWFDAAVDNITLTGAGATVTVGGDLVTIGVPTFAVTDSGGGAYTVGVGNGAVALSVSGSDFVLTPAFGSAASVPVASVNSFVVNGITMTATLFPANNLTVSGTGGVTISVGDGSPTATYALTTSADAITATDGASIAAVNGGAATTAERLNLTGAITMTQAQHEAFTTVTAAGGSDSIAISTGGAVTAAAAIETYTVSGGGANNVTINAGKTGANITGAAGNVTTVTLGGQTITGTYALGNAADVIVATTGANIAGVNTGNATTAETLELTGAITMTQAQHAEFTTVTATGGSDKITLTTAGAVTAAAAIETYEVVEGSTVTVGTAAGNLAQVITETGAVGTVTNFTLDAGTYTGVWTAIDASDVVKIVNGTNVAGNTGLNAGVVIDFQDATGTVTFNATQNGVVTFANVATGTHTVNVSAADTFTAAAGIETYGIVAASNITVLAATNVNGEAATDQTVTIGGLTVTGTYALDTGTDVIVATTGASIAGVNGGAATTAETLTLTGAITMTQVQHDAFTTVTATGGSDAVTITTGGAVTARAGVESYSVSSGAANNLFVNAGATNITGNSANATTVTIAGNTVSGSWTLGNAADVIDAATGANIAGVNTGSATTAERLTLVGTITMTAAQYVGLNNANLVAGGTSDRIIFTTTVGGEVLNAAVENFTLVAGNDTINLGANGQSIDAQALTAGQSLSLAGSFTVTATLTAGNLAGASATGAITVTGGTAANTITTGDGNDTVNGGDGDDFITGGAGIDTLNGQNGNDTFFYGSMGLFLSANALLDLVDGGNNTDTAEIAGDITLTTASDLTRMTSVERITARSQAAAQQTHSVTINSDANLGGVTTIDLSGDTRSASTATFNFTGATTAMTLKGVGAGVNTIIGGSGADTLIGGSGNDFFIFVSAAAAATDTAITGGGGNDTVLFRSQVGATLVVDDRFSAGLSYMVTTNSTATADFGLSAENINASTHTLGAVTLTGNAGNNILTGTSSADTLVGGGGNDIMRGGASNDTITRSLLGTTTYVFENNASNNGNDTLNGVRADNTFNDVFDFSAFLGASVIKRAAVDANNQLVGLDLATGDNVGVRYGTASLGTGNIVLVTDNAVAGEVAIADNGKAVVFSFSSSSVSGSATGTIYYVQDTDSGPGQQWQVFAVGSINSNSGSTDIASFAGYSNYI